MNESAISIGNTISEAIPIISVGAWERDEDNPIFPVGANPKRLLICPDPPPHDDLIAGHRYLFKTAQGWKAKQFWSEFIAYKVSMACQVPVPRCFIAANEVGADPGHPAVTVEEFHAHNAEMAGRWPTTMTTPSGTWPSH